MLRECHEQLTDATIMIVDDEPITMEVVKIFLEEVGYHNFVMVEKAAEATKTLEETRPDILLLDLVMPEVSGFDILAEVRKLPKFRHLPIIILTSSSDSESKLRALDLGATDFLAKPVDKSELGLRIRNTLAAKAYQDQLAYYDPLTSLPNRKLFLERFDWSLKESHRHGDNLALLHIELDNFDRINDTMGLSAGDEVLRLIARRIEGVIRSNDILGHPAHEEKNRMNLFRIDGGIFSLLLDRIESAESSALVAERILLAIKEPLSVEGKDLYLTASIGIATYPSDQGDHDTLLRLASSAKDFVKNRGGDSFQFSSGHINAMYEKRLSLESRLRGALGKNEFVLHYQPKVDIKTGCIKGVEALVRWKSNDEALIPPGDFIQLAEEIGVIVPIGEWILNEACRQLKEWQQAGASPLSISVNLSVKQFEAPNLVAMVKRIINRSGIDPQFLTLELTESLLLDNVEDKINILKGLKNLGLKLSIDDFGTGYSSLSYLRDLPVDELKIDRSFIKELSDDADSRAIVSAVIFLSHGLGMSTVAEGIEKHEQLRFLEEKLCDEYQGFLFSRPVPGAKLLELLSLNGSIISQNTL